MSHDPGHPGAVDDRWDLGVDRPRRPVDVLRTVVAGLLGTLAVLLLALAWLLTAAAVHLASPDHPGRLAVIVLAVPELRTDAAGALVDDVEDELGRPFPPEERAALTADLVGVLGSGDVERALTDLQVVDGTVDAGPFLDVVADQLLEAAEGSPGDASAAALRRLAAEVTSSADEAGPLDEDVTRGLSASRELTLGAALVAGVPGVVAGVVATAVARRRGLTAVLVVSGSLVLAALALTPVVAVLLPATAGLLLEATADVIGSGTVWTLLLAALLPPAAWLPVRASRGQRESSTITS